MRIKEDQAIKVGPGEVLVVKPIRPMTGAEFDLLGQQLDARSKKTGVDMVLIPFSAKVAGTQPKAAAKKTTTKKATGKKTTPATK